MFLYPFLLDYTPKEYIWGGTKLIKSWNKISSNATIAESFELSINDDAQSRILNGYWRGKRLAEVLEKHPDFLSKRGQGYDKFPVLTKLIDAKKSLSIQVHPDEEYASNNEGQTGKLEVWYICDADNDGAIYLGLNQDLTKEEITKAISNNTIEEYLNKVKVHKGDYYLVPPKTVHAIKAGVTLLEIQQNSNITYRVYDYDRLDKFGKKRELHISKSLEVMSTKKYSVPQQNNVYQQYDGYKLRELISCQYFKTKEYKIFSQLLLHNIDSFIAFTVVEGDGLIDSYKIKKGNTVFLPANCKCTINGTMKIITVEI